MAWWQFRRKSDKPEPVFEPYRLKNGIPNDIPPAVFRKLRQIKMSMLCGDRGRIRAIQQSLIRGGWEIPTTASQCDEITQRYKDHVAKAFI